MYSSEDLERFYVEYQSEWVPRGMTMRAFCDRNNVPYRVMENFVSNIRKKIVEVEVTGCPPEAESAQPTTDATAGPEKSARWMYIPMPGEESRRPVGGTKASPEFLQALAYETYVKRVSLGNLLRQLQDIGMSVCKNTLRNWLKKGKRHLDRLIKELKDKALEKDSIVNCDETWCKVRRFNKYLKKYMWVLVNKSEKIVIFFYYEGSRGRKALTDFMGEAEVRAIMTDGYTARQIYKARQSAETSEIERQLRALLAEGLKKENPKRSYYMEQALSYFDHFKDGLFLYRKDGSYPIDNNLAERQVRPFTALRKVIQHYGSDEGAEMAAVYLSVASTVKLAGVSVWRFLGDFFEDVVTGGRKHLGHLRLSPV